MPSKRKIEEVIEKVKVTSRVRIQVTGLTMPENELLVIKPDCATIEEIKSDWCEKFEINSGYVRMLTPRLRIIPEHRTIYEVCSIIEGGPVSMIAETKVEINLGFESSLTTSLMIYPTLTPETLENYYWNHISKRERAPMEFSLNDEILDKEKSLWKQGIKDQSHIQITLGKYNIYLHIPSQPKDPPLKYNCWGENVTAEKLFSFIQSQNVAGSRLSCRGCQRQIQQGKGQVVPVACCDVKSLHLIVSESIRDIAVQSARTSCAYIVLRVFVNDSTVFHDDFTLIPSERQTSVQAHLVELLSQEVSSYNFHVQYGYILRDKQFRRIAMETAEKNLVMDTFGFTHVVTCDVIQAKVLVPLFEDYDVRLPLADSADDSIDSDIDDEGLESEIFMGRKKCVVTVHCNTRFYEVDKEGNVNFIGDTPMALYDKAYVALVFGWWIADMRERRKGKFVLPDNFVDTKLVLQLTNRVTDVVSKESFRSLEKLRKRFPSSDRREGHSVMLMKSGAKLPLFRFGSERVVWLRDGANVTIKDGIIQANSEISTFLTQRWLQKPHVPKRSLPPADVASTSV